MRRLFLLVLSLLCAAGGMAQPSSSIYLSSTGENDLLVALQAAGARVQRARQPADLIEMAPPSSAVLLLADDYPEKRVELDETMWKKAEDKGLRLYVEFPSWLPGQTLGATRDIKWERLIVSSDSFGAKLPERRILVAHDCHYLPVEMNDPLLVVGKVAGYNHAVYGIPQDAAPILGQWPGSRFFVATTKLSGFVSGRFAPVNEWETLWNWILSELGTGIRIQYHPTVSPSFRKDEPLPPGWQSHSLKRTVDWYRQSGLLLSEKRWETLEPQLRQGLEMEPQPGPVEPGGDGSRGVIEGYASEVSFEGYQHQRLAIRADCQAESALVFASEYLLSRAPESRQQATNLLQFLYVDSGLHGGVRGNPEHPAFGLISWGAIAPAWEIANYGDDNARTMLATMFVAGALQSSAWDQALLKALIANLRTTGKRGFRGDRIDIGPLEQKGWKHYHDAETINYSPHFEAYSWACFLWAYHHTRYEPFLEKSRTAIALTMKAFPDHWRWNDNMERAHMLLPLAWLVRLENTDEHRRWLRTVAYDLLSRQDECGGLQERFRSAGGHYQLPQSNEAYGTTETPLLQENGDPVTDQLYVGGFALLGLHEAAAVLDDEKIARGADQLAEYLARIQTRSPRHPFLDGTWFRAFDYQRWEPWGSSGDLGWGAWCVEAGWAQAWGAALLGLREKNTTLWDLTAGSRIVEQWDTVQALMQLNSGGPWVQPTSPKP